MTILPKKKQPTRDRERGQPPSASASDPHITHNRLVDAPIVPARTSISLDSHANVRKGRSCVVSNSTSKCASPDNNLDDVNSGDEYEPARSKSKTDQIVDEQLIQQEVEEERIYEEMLVRKGFKLHRVGGDGACLFRAVAHQIYGDEEMHGQVRTLCMDFMAKNMSHFSQFITEDFQEYITRKRMPHVHGNNVEMQAIAELFNRPILVFDNSTDPINTFQCNSLETNAPIRVRYTKGVHYDSIIDPYAATVGVGLGMADLNPGMADRNLMLEGQRVSEAHDIEQTMLEDKIKATDWQATEEELKEKAARDSYLDWLRVEENKMKENAPCHSRSLPSPKSQHTSNNKPISPNASKAPSPCREQEACSSKSITGEQTKSLYPNAILNATDYGVSDFADEDEMMRQVLALSQQEYIESFKKDSHEKKD